MGEEHQCVVLATQQTTLTRHRQLVCRDADHVGHAVRCAWCIASRIAWSNTSGT